MPIEQGATNPGYYCLAFTALAGVVISLYYYFGVIRAIYWSRDAGDTSTIVLSTPLRACLAVCIAGMLFLGIFPGAPLQWVDAAIQMASF